MLLNNEEFQMNVLDIIAKDEKELGKYSDIYHQYKETAKRLADTIAKAEKEREDEDYIRFQLQQLDDASLKEGEQEELENEAEMLAHAEEIKSNLFKVSNMMAEDDMNMLIAMKESILTLQNVSKHYPAASEWAERLNSCFIDIKELSHEISNAQEEVEFNPSRLEFVNDKLNTIYSLEQKHHVDSVEQLIEIAEKYRSQLTEITSFDQIISELESKKEKIYSDLLAQAKVLTSLRRKAAQDVEKKMQELLVPLGMPNVRFCVEVTQRKEPDTKGMDNVLFLFSANKNGTLQNVATVASGGEIARVMLSLKAMIAGAVKLPTIVFDEIDTGVSGSIAEKMALIMEDMGKHNRQVISITHLPQIAARGTTHYKVYKEDTETRTISHIKMLDQNERIKEIANMLSGSTLTEAAMNNAKVLLGITN
jgi:DNA repair protein RecN (Recombination protein N)